MANQLGKRYLCETCSTEVLCNKPGPGAVECCGQEMKLLSENTVDAAKEKHLPVIEVGEGVVKVTIGSVAHPMEEKHGLRK